MPYTTSKTDKCPASKPWGVFKRDGGEPLGCHATKSGAVDQIGAIESNEKKDYSMDKSQEETFGDTIQLVSRALRETNRRAFLVDISDKWVVYETYGDDGDHLVKRSYSVQDGQVSFADDESEVRRRSIYVPIAKTEAAASLVEVWGAEMATDLAESRTVVTNLERTEFKPGSIQGIPATDLPHAFTQDEGSHPFFCSECGRSKTHPLHKDG